MEVFENLKANLVGKYYQKVKNLVSSKRQNAL